MRRAQATADRRESDPDPRRRDGWQRLAFIGSMLALATSSAAACSAPDGSLFGSSNATGAGGAASGAGTTSTGPASAASGPTTSSAGAGGSTASASGTSASSASTGASSASTGASSSSGGAVCGNKICEPPAETPVFCPQDCQPTGSATSGSGGPGTCNHAACDTGDALDPACDPCAGTVCGSDPYCCDTAWDGQCVGEADQQCGACCGNGMCNEGEDCNNCAQDCPGPCAPNPTCPHSACFVDGPLDPALCRDPCVDMVCAQDASCCMTWQDKCSILALGCGADPCVTAVCAAMPSCCSSGWTQACVDQAKTSCNTQCDCSHSICQGGAVLDGSCNPCAAEICKADSYCCDTDWDGICVGEVGSICGIVCN